MGSLGSDGSTIPKDQEIVFHPHVFGARPQVTAFESRESARESALKYGWKEDGDKLYCLACQHVEHSQSKQAGNPGEAKP
jgi:hypothetical protein